jgi:hypothetical protein
MAPSLSYYVYFHKKLPAKRMNTAEPPAAVAVFSIQYSIIQHKILLQIVGPGGEAYSCSFVFIRGS